MYNMNLIGLLKRETVADVMADFEDKVTRLEAIGERASEDIKSNNAAISAIQSVNEDLVQERDRAARAVAAIRKILS